MLVTENKKHKNDTLHDPADPQVTEGVYRVLKVTWQPGKGGRCVALANSFETRDAFLPGAGCIPWLQENAPYRMRLFRDAAGWDQIDPDAIQSAPSSNPLELIPQSWTDRPDVIPNLLALYGALSSAAIKRFWQAVFSDKVWLRRFLRCPASRTCHHDQPGGLFAHSVEVALLTRRTLQPLVALLSLEIDAATSVALLHDAAKIVLMSNYPGRWQLPFDYREHERFLPHFLEAPLVELRKQDRIAWATLVRILNDYCHPQRKPNSPLAEIVRSADHLSAHADARRTAQVNAPSARNFLTLCSGWRTWVPT